jgi:hypothetical protein
MAEFGKARHAGTCLLPVPPLVYHLLLERSNDLCAAEKEPVAS